jgi:hypothetical protein
MFSPQVLSPRVKGDSVMMGERMTWPEICESDELQGLWVALDHCRYDESTMEPIEGEVVDADEDLSSLCSRMREAGRGSCAIRLCRDGRPDSTPRAPRSEVSPRHLT